MMFRIVAMTAVSLRPLGPLHEEVLTLVSGRSAASKIINTTIRV